MNNYYLLHIMSLIQETIATLPYYVNGNDSLLMKWELRESIITFGEYYAVLTRTSKNKNIPYDVIARVQYDCKGTITSSAGCQSIQMPLFSQFNIIKN